MKNMIEPMLLATAVPVDEVGPSTAQLGRCLEERTAELVAVRLEMKKLSHAVGHDLRGPLMHIGGFADLLLDHAGAQLDEKGRQYLLKIITSTDALARMLTEILAFSRQRQTGAPAEPAGSGTQSGKAAHEAAAADGNVVATG